MAIVPLTPDTILTPDSILFPAGLFVPDAITVSVTPGIDTLPQLRADTRVERLAVDGGLPLLATTLDTALSE